MKEKESSREQVRRLLTDRTRGGDGKLLSFAAIGDRLGISRERVRQLAKEVGVRGRTGGGRLRGQRRFFKKDGKGR